VCVCRAFGRRQRDDEGFALRTATTRATVPGRPFTRWSIRKLVDHLHRNTSRPVKIGRAALRRSLTHRGSSARCGISP
jgi:hypothetical protein